MQEPEILEDPVQTNAQILVSDFETGEKTVVTADKTSCWSYFNRASASFAVAAVISLGSITFAATMLATSGGSGALTPFYTSLISGTISYWFTPPSLQKKDNPPK